MCTVIVAVITRPLLMLPNGVAAPSVFLKTRGAAEKIPGTHTPLGRNSDRFAPERSDGTTGEHPLIVQRSGPDNVSRMAETCQKSHVNVSMENPDPIAE